MVKKLVCLLVLLLWCSPSAYAQDISIVKEKINRLETLLLQQLQTVSDLEAQLKIAKDSLSDSSTLIAELQEQLKQALLIQEALKVDLQNALTLLNGLKNGWIVPSLISGGACLLIGLICGIVFVQ